MRNVGTGQPKSVAIYARYSTDMQQESSIDDQIRLCKAEAARHGWHVAEIYFDAAISGGSHARPGYQALLADLRRGRFSIILAAALDRLSRDQEHLARFHKDVRFFGAEVWTVSDGLVNEMHVGVHATMSALMLKRIAESTRSGLEGRVLEGRSAGGRSYGYRLTVEHDARGDRVAGGLEVDPEQAQTVRRIFQDFAEGTSPLAIAKRLNAEGVAGPRGRAWRDTTIRGHAGRGTGILRNELYIGMRIWNRMRYMKDPATSRRVSRMNRTDEWIRQPVPDLQIVDADLWERVQDRLRTIEISRSAAVRSSPFWLSRRPKHLTTGLVFCGKCGGTMGNAGRDYLGCNNARKSGTCDSRRSIRRSAVEDLVLEGLRYRLMEPETTKRFVDDVRACLASAAREHDQVRTRKEQKLADLRKRQDGLIDAIAAGLRNKAIQDKLTETEAEVHRLTLELEAAPARSPIALHPNLGEVYRAKVVELTALLSDPDQGTSAREAVRQLIEKIVIHPAPEGEGQPQVELVGDVAMLVELAVGGGETPKAPREGGASDDGLFRRSVKVVAGAGFEPATFRL